MASNILGQIAISVGNLATSGTWYENVLGLVQAGGSKFSGEKVAQVTGVEGSDLEARWLIDQQERFQYELFKVNNPPARPRPVDWLLSDEGYAMVGIHVSDFDATLARAICAGSIPIHPPVGSSGQRRVCVPDPDGNIIELMEDDPREEDLRPRPWQAAAALRFITLVVPDVDIAAAFFQDALGLAIADGLELHVDQHFRLWGLDDAERTSVVLWAGDMLLELVTYLKPMTRPKPTSYKLTDLGWLNAAFLFYERQDLHTSFADAIKLGATPNFPEIADFGGFAVMYLESPQSFSIEMFQVDPPFMRDLGFTPWDSELHESAAISVDLPPSMVWEKLFSTVPAFASSASTQARLFTGAFEGPLVFAGNVVEFREGDHWWLEKILSVTDRTSVTFLNLQSGAITRYDLSGSADVSKPSTLISIKQCAVPSWEESDNEEKAQLSRDVGVLSKQVKVFLIS